MHGVVLELFPGAGLFGKAFEAAGWCVVRGPDILWGGDVRDFHASPGYFDGVIGGPPCQVFSTAGFQTSHAVNLIPEYIRIVNEAQPKWAVMENVRGALPCAPDWPHVFIRDWDCGGFTHRLRGFWFMGIPCAPLPPRRSGKPVWSVLASSYHNRKPKDKPTSRQKQYVILKPSEAARLQGYPGLDEKIMSSQPMDVSPTGRRCLAIHMLGNGVPKAMGDWVARHVTEYVTTGKTFAKTQHVLLA